MNRLASFISSDPDEPRRLIVAQLSAAIVGIIALAVCLFAGFFDPSHTLRGYLFAWLVYLGIALGAMSIVMLHALTGGAWGWTIRKPAEAAAMTLPALLILFIPIAVGLRYVYPWADAHEVAGSALLRHRQTLFAPAFVILRAIIYFAVWILWAWKLGALSARHDQTGDPNLLARLRIWSAAGFVVYFATMSLAAVDWVASREIDWYSSTFGLLTIVGQSLIGTAFLIIVLCLLLRDAPAVQEVLNPDRVHDLGNLLLTLVVLWTYIEFAQFLVIWIGNTQEDNIWYFHRTHLGWEWVGLAIILVHFALPFVFLLFQEVKRSLPALVGVAGIVLVMRIVHVLWMVAPSSSDPQPHAAHWLDLVALIGVGGVWLACFLWLVRRRPLAPTARARSSEHQEDMSYDGKKDPTYRPTV
jgi:hypothetical protein